MIRTVFFDMGNVLLHFSHERMCAQIGELCRREGAAVRRLLFETGLQQDFESGRFTEIEVLERLQVEFDHPLELAALQRAVSDIFVLNESIVPVIDALKSRGHRLVLLSNTCVSHLNWVQREFDILQRFDHLVTSFEAGAMKPDEAIYRAALEAAQCAPHECFYTDDIPDYVAAARALGIDAEVFIDTSTLLEHLSQRGISLKVG